MDRAALIDFVRRHPHAVEATVTADGAPQAAVVGVAVERTGATVCRDAGGADRGCVQPLAIVRAASDTVSLFIGVLIGQV